MRFVLCSTVCMLSCSTAVRAINVPFRKTAVTSGRSRPPSSGLSLRDDDPYDFANMRDNVYTAEVFVAGQNYTVQLDTGSSDLWIDPAVAGTPFLQNTQNTGVQAAICYIDTTCAAGPILIGNVTFGGQSVPEQAFINAVGSNATYQGMNGLLGLGSTAPGASSVTHGLSNQPTLLFNGSTFLNNLLDRYPNEGNYMTFLLSRNETGDGDGGIFTIGEVAQGLESVQQTPQLPVLMDTRWATAINGMIINGVPVIAPSSTSTAGLSPGQLLANFDTGTARSAAPPVFVDAMYQDQPGAVYNGVGGYTLPCNDMVTVDIVIGNERFPIHPIDLVVIPDKGENSRTDGSEWICVGAFSYLPPGSTDVDIILGDSFLRNVYARYYLGNWTRAADVAPYIQLLSTTDEGNATSEYAALNSARIAARRSLQAKPNRQSSSAPSFIHATTLSSFLIFISHVLLITIVR